MWYVEANPNPNGYNPVGWVLKSSHNCEKDAKDALQTYLTDGIHDADPNHWRITSDEPVDSEKPAKRFYGVNPHTFEIELLTFHEFFQIPYRRHFARCKTEEEAHAWIERAKEYKKLIDTIKSLPQDRYEAVVKAVNEIADPHWGLAPDECLLSDLI